MKKFIRALFLFSFCIPLLLPAQQTFELSYHNSVYSRFGDVTWLRNDAVACIMSANDPPLGAYVESINAFSPAGQLLWKRTYPGTPNEAFTFEHLRPTPDGGLIVAGYATNPVTGNFYDPFLLKTDSLGQAQWSKIYAGPHNENNIGNIRPTHDGGYIVCGITYSNQNNYWYYLLKTDSAGNREWGKLYHHISPTKLYLDDVYEDENGDYYCTGSFADTIAVMKVSHTGVFRWLQRVGIQNFSFALPRSLAPSHTPGAFLCTGKAVNGTFVFEMDTLGGVNWTKTYNNIMAEDLTGAPGGYAIAGNALSLDGALMIIDNTGQVTWNRYYPSSKRLVAIDTLRSGKGYAACGTHPGSQGPDYGYLLRTDSTGKIYCNELTQSITASPATITIDTLVMIESNYFSAGAYDVIAQNVTMYDSLLCTGTVSIAENNSESALQVRPVPAGDQLFIELPGESQWNIQLIDALGKTALSKTLRGKTHTLSTGELPRGIYLLRAEGGDTALTKKIILR